MSSSQDAKKSTSGSALQVIVLGCGGGPQENNVTALLVRATETGWGRGSIVAVDAGVHLSAITRIVEESQPEGLGTTVELPHKLENGPFAGMEIKSTSPSVNASHITKHLIDTYLITHTHLDHIAGFVVNTAGLPGTRPKRLAGLPATISAFKNHIFNNVIWPNLSDENNGAGLVTYMRLVDGGSPALGEGDAKGYVEVSDGLVAKSFSVSHGHCIEKHSHRGSTSSSRFGSTDISMMSPRGVPGSNATSGSVGIFRASNMAHSSGSQERPESICVYDSSAYFIREPNTGREVLIFGDVEPDTISLSPRNHDIWKEAAPKIANGQLPAIFIECSYVDSQTNDRLFGHMAPRFIIEEMCLLAQEVEQTRQNSAKLETTKKRKREMEESLRSAKRDSVVSSVDDNPVSPKTVKMTPRESISAPESSTKQQIVDHHGIETPHIATPTRELALDLTTCPSILHAFKTENPLKGLKIVIIHVKDNLSDGETAGDIILKELLEYDKKYHLGCEFIISRKGQSFVF